jgi:hypothetical protein
MGEYVVKKGYKFYTKDENGKLVRHSAGDVVTVSDEAEPNLRSKLMPKPAAAVKKEPKPEVEKKETLIKTSDVKK